MKWTEGRFAVVSVEGNGQRPPGIVELAVVPIVDGDIGEPTSWLLRPTEPITGFATRIHGIKNGDVANAPSLDDVRDRVLEALAGRAVVAHTSYADISMLSRELPGWQPAEVIDTLTLARHLMPLRPSYTLGALVAELGLDRGMPAELVPHRATYDALLDARLFIYLMALGRILVEKSGGSADEVTDGALF